MIHSSYLDGAAPYDEVAISDLWEVAVDSKRKHAFHTLLSVYFYEKNGVYLGMDRANDIASFIGSSHEMIAKVCTAFQCANISAISETEPWSGKIRILLNDEDNDWSNRTIKSLASALDKTHPIRRSKKNPEASPIVVVAAKIKQALVNRLCSSAVRLSVDDWYDNIFWLLSISCRTDAQ